ncbi:MAG: hypothetical protein HC800_19090, partial [Phormidesmis sp. RL_2_1]|nr:hypothetical protein [Phormidesmis sp. RL_2_1]
ERGGQKLSDDEIGEGWQHFATGAGGPATKTDTGQGSGHSVRDGSADEGEKGCGESTSGRYGNGDVEVSDLDCGDKGFVGLYSR